MDDKTCTRCGQTKPLTEFYKDRSRQSGIYSRCKVCKSRDEKNYRSRTTPKKQPHTKRDYRETYKRRAEKSREYKRRERAKHIDRTRARLRVQYAVNHGLLLPIKQCECIECGTPAAEYHHSDYSKPLDVMALCRKCHAAMHPRRRMETQ